MQGKQLIDDLRAHNFDDAADRLATYEAALRECVGLVKLARTLTGCRADDDYLDGIEATIRKALETK